MKKSVSIPDEELEIQFSRSSGAGGQNVNKVNTRVTLRWSIGKNRTLSPDVIERFLKKWQGRINNEGDVIIDCEKFRSQHRNREEAIKKLKKMVEDVLEKPKTRKATKPSKRAKERRLREKKQHSEKKSGRKNVDW